MQGVVFNIIEEVVLTLHGEEMWDEIIDASGVDGVYSSTGNYDDAEVFAIVGAASEALSVPVEDLLLLVGRHAFDGLIRRYPQMIGSEDNTVDFLQRVEDFIHPEVKKLYPNAVLPKFDFEDLPDGRTRMIYTSPRDLHFLAEGMIMGAGEHFGEEIVIERPDVQLGTGSTAFDLAIKKVARTA